MQTQTDPGSARCVGCDDASPNPVNPHGWCDDCNLIASVDRPNDEGVAR